MDKNSLKEVYLGNKHQRYSSGTNKKTINQERFNFKKILKMKPLNLIKLDRIDKFLVKLKLKKVWILEINKRLKSKLQICLLKMNLRMINLCPQTFLVIKLNRLDYSEPLRTLAKTKKHKILKALIYKKNKYNQI